MIAAANAQNKNHTPRTSTKVYPRKIYPFRGADAVNKDRTIAFWNGDSPRTSVRAHFRPDDKSGNTTRIEGFDSYTLEAIKDYAYSLLVAVESGSTAQIEGFDGYPPEVIETYARKLLSAVGWLRAREGEHAESA